MTEIAGKSFIFLGCASILAAFGFWLAATWGAGSQVGFTGLLSFGFGLVTLAIGLTMDA